MNPKLESDPRVDPRIKKAFVAMAGAPRPDVASREELLTQEHSPEGLAAYAKQVALYDSMDRQDIAPSTGLTVRTETFTSAPDGNTVKIRYIRPEGDALLPCIYYIHGGRMAFSSCYEGNYRTWGRMMAARGVAVAMVDFRNSVHPGSSSEVAPFPAGLNDCISGLQWVHSNAASLGIDPTRIVVAGESGGGNLSLALGMALRRRGALGLIKGIYALCPYIAGRWPQEQYPSSIENEGIGFYFQDNRATVAYGIEAFDAGNPLAWPAFATRADVVGLPPVVISVNECDALRDEGIAFYRLLLSAGVAARCRQVMGACHGIEILPVLCPDIARSTAADMAEFTINRRKSDMNAQAPAASGTPANTGTEALLFKDDPQFWFEIERLFGEAEYGGAAFGEVIAMASKIKSGDYDSWYAGMSDFADRLADEAAAQLRKGHRISARDNYLRASNYYRSADFFLHANGADPRVKRAFELSTACYRQAAALFTPPIEPVEIPFEGTTLTGYFHHADDSETPRKTLLLGSGFDGSPEESHFLGARAAVERGYNVLAFDGPGQYSSVHRQGLHFRPNWETIVTPVVDCALSRKEVDPKRIALHCESLGGYLSPRAAAFEHRLAACICDDGVYDHGTAMLALFPADKRDAMRAALFAPSAPEVDAILAHAMETNTVIRWYFTHGMYAFGKSTPRAMMASSMDYHLRDGIAERIQCPTLVCEAEKDLFYQGQAQQLFEHLTCSRTMMKFTDAEGAGAHCQMGASRLAYARIYDWLDETLAAVG